MSTSEKSDCRKILYGRYGLEYCVLGDVKGKLTLRSFEGSGPLFTGTPVLVGVEKPRGFSLQTQNGIDRLKRNNDYL
jgi:hypothetical protein